MKKTLLITYFFPPQIGGIENYYLNLCQNLPTDKIIVLTQKNNGDLKFDQNQKYKIYRVDFFSGFFPPSWWHLKNKISKIKKEEGIEQIIFGHFHPMALLSNYFLLPYFIFIHGTDIRQVKNSLWQKIALKNIYKSCKKIIANSSYVAKLASDLIGNDNKISIIYPAINFSDFSESSNELNNKRTELGLKDNDLLLLSVGRLIEQKNFQTIIKLLPDLLLDFPNLKYIIVGDGQMKDELATLADNLGVKDKIIFIGSIDNNESKKIYYQLSDLFISVSTTPEGFGITYLEAQASGLPVIASKVGGSAEALIDNKTGILVYPDNLGQIKEAIIELLSNETKRINFGQAGKDLVREKFNWSVQINKIKEIL